MGSEKYEILDEVAAAMFDDEFSGTFEKFAEEHCGEFTDDEENKLIYTEIYNKFTELFEEKLAALVEARGSTSEAFAALAREARDEGAEDASDSLAFILALAEYEVFVGIMREKAKDIREASK
jgi:ADP-ribosylation factor 2-binding protein